MWEYISGGMGLGTRKRKYKCKVIVLIRIYGRWHELPIPILHFSVRVFHFDEWNIENEKQIDPKSYISKAFINYDISIFREQFFLKQKFLLT